MMLLAVGDVVYQALIAAVVTVIMAWMAHRVAKKAETAAVKVEEVKVTLKETQTSTDDKLDSIASTGDKTHALVNGAMSIQLKINMVSLKRIADLTKHPDDEAAAELAEKSYNEHVAKQPKEP